MKIDLKHILKNMSPVKGAFYFLSAVGFCLAAHWICQSVNSRYRLDSSVLAKMPKEESPKIKSLYLTPPYGRDFPNVPSWGVIWYQLERMDCQSLEDFAVQQGLVQLSDQVKSPKDYGDFQCLDRDILRNTIFDRLVKGYLVSLRKISEQLNQIQTEKNDKIQFLEEEIKKHSDKKNLSKEDYNGKLKKLADFNIEFGYLLSNINNIEKSFVYSAGVYNGIFHKNNPNAHNRKVSIGKNLIQITPIIIGKNSTIYRRHGSEIRDVNAAYLIRRNRNEMVKDTLSSNPTSSPSLPLYAHLDEEWIFSRTSAAKQCDTDEENMPADPIWLLDGKFDPQEADRYYWGRFEEYVSRRSCQDVLKITKRIDFFPPEIQKILDTQVEGKESECLWSGLVKDSVYWYVFNGAFEKMHTSLRESMPANFLGTKEKQMKNRVNNQYKIFKISELLFFYHKLGFFCKDASSCPLVYTANGTTAPATSDLLAHLAETYAPVGIDKDPYSDAASKEFQSSEADWDKITLPVLVTSATEK